MAVVQSTIKSAILSSINSNGKDNNLTKDQSIDKFADDLVTIIKNAILSGDIKILPTELTTKVSSVTSGGPVVCTTNLNGSIT